jgi:CBS domain-containing protein
MDLSSASEFADEYQDWLEGHLGKRRALWFDIPVGQLEPHPLLAVAPDTPVRRAIDLMNAHDCGAVMVVHDDELVGIFTERDALQRVLPRNLDLDRVLMLDVMTADPDVLAESATLAQALRTMARARYRHLPVLDAQGRPVSMVSMRRIIQFVCEAFPEEILNAPPERNSGTFELDGG